MNGMFSPAVLLREIDPDTLVSIEDNREAIEFGVKLSSAMSDGGGGLLPLEDDAFLQIRHSGAALQLV